MDVLAYLPHLSVVCASLNEVATLVCRVVSKNERLVARLGGIESHVLVHSLLFYTQMAHRGESGTYMRPEEGASCNQPSYPQVKRFVLLCRPEREREEGRAPRAKGTDP